MLRRRLPVVAAPNQEPLYAKKASRAASPRALANTLLVAIVAALWPSEVVRSREYSTYLTSKVQNLTIGWHLFRVVTEGAFLATYGLRLDTVVVQLFWSASVGSVLLYFWRRRIWLRVREDVCVYTNVMYGVITVLKIFHLVPRLPNESNYMFKHCMLTMFDAAFSQTPVHRQYVIQFAEAVIRCIVWQRYGVLADTPFAGVVAVSLAWQVWLCSFSCMLQARHVSAFARERAAAGPATAAAATASTSSACSPYTTALAVSVQQQNSHKGAAAEMQPPSAPGAADGGEPATSAAHGIAQAAPPPAALSSARRRSTASRAAQQAQQEGGNMGSCAAAAVDRAMRSGGNSSASQDYMRALRAVARGPSSYVLLSHQRRQAGQAQSASAQLYLAAANPDMLPPNWRERLSGAIAEGAPGWQLVGACVRRGSLYVHLDLVFAGRACAVPQPGKTAVAPAPLPGDDSAHEALDAYLYGMNATELLELLGLPHDTPAGPARPVEVQRGSLPRSLAYSVPCDSEPATMCGTGAGGGDDAAAVEDGVNGAQPAAVGCTAEVEVPPSADAGATGDRKHYYATGDATNASVAAAAAAAAAVGAAGGAPANASASAAAAAAPAWLVSAARGGPLRAAVSAMRCALVRPPHELYDPDYARFLTARVGGLHLSYCAFMCATAMAFVALRLGTGISVVTLALFMNTELLSLAAAALLGGAWWRVRCALVYLGAMVYFVQMSACTTGLLPHVVTDSHCVSGRWVQKVMLVSTLQAICFQCPVRTAFLFRAPTALVCTYVHVAVCRSVSLLPAVALHGGVEAAIMLLCALLQLRHVEAFRRSRRQELSPKNSSGSDASCAEPAPAATSAAGASTSVPPAKAHAAAAAAAAAHSRDPTDATDVTDVYLSCPVAVVVGGRPGHLQLNFIVDGRHCLAVLAELQVVVRHVGPAAAATGVHTSVPGRSVAQSLEASAAAAHDDVAPHKPVPCVATLTLGAAPADAPGLVHVELWRRRQRLHSTAALLLVADAEPSQAQQTQQAQLAWADETAAYVLGLAAQGHAAAGEQFIEELGGWLAAVAGVEREMAAGSGGEGPAAAARVASVLRFVPSPGGGFASFSKPGGGVGGGTGVAGGAVGGGGSGSLREALRALLGAQGGMLLAVAVEAGCGALAEALLARLTGPLGCSVGALLDAARTPVTQLPLLHAAVKSGSARMVDMVAGWAAAAGVVAMWGAEASVMALSLGPLSDSLASSTASTGFTKHLATSSLPRGTPYPTPSAPFAAAAAAGAADGGARPGAAIYESFGETPFRVIDCRVSNQLGRFGRPRASAAAAAGDGTASCTISSGAAWAPRELDEGRSASASAQQGSSSLVALCEGGVVVVTPLHLALALGDEGRLAAHILRTYPEATQLWRAQEHTSAPVAAGVPGERPSWDAAYMDLLPRNSIGAHSGMGGAGPASARSSGGGESVGHLSPLRNLGAVAAACTSAPPPTSHERGAARRERGAEGAWSGDGGGWGELLASVSLSEVAFLEGMRWVEEEAPRAPGFKVMRV